MHLTVILACLTALAAPQTAAPGATPSKDRDAAVRYLESTRQEFLTSIDGLSEAQWTFKAAPDRWSIAEVAEHIALTEPMLLGLVSDKIAKGPKATQPPAVSDDKVIASITDRTQKGQAPEMLKPTNRWATRDALTKDFLAARQKTIDYVTSTPVNLREHMAPHPLLKELDGHQWILYLAGHSARHTAQLNEVKTSPGYPAK